MRRRSPGFYVCVVTFGVELFDGPWPTADAAARRAEEIGAKQPRQMQIVEVASDGVTVVRQGKHAS